MSQADTDEKELTFASEEAERTWKLLREIDRISEQVGPEEKPIKWKKVRPLGALTGTAMRQAGTTIGRPSFEKGVFLVPERSLDILDRVDLNQVNISYEIVE